MTIKQTYCTKDLCLLLEKKGIDASHIMRFEKGGSWYKAYTLDVICKWLREVHKVFVEINTSIDLNGKYHYNYTILDSECKYVRRRYTYFYWTYEDAQEAAIRYCLENLV